MPRDEDWPEPQPYLVAAAVVLSTNRWDASVAALGAADDILERARADEAGACRWVAALIHLAVARRTSQPAAQSAQRRLHPVPGDEVGDYRRGDGTRGR